DGGQQLVDPALGSLVVAGAREAEAAARVDEQRGGDAAAAERAPPFARQQDGERVARLLHERLDQTDVLVDVQRQELHVAAARQLAVQLGDVRQLQLAGPTPG